MASGIKCGLLFILQSRFNNFNDFPGYMQQSLGACSCKFLHLYSNGSLKSAVSLGTLDCWGIMRIFKMNVLLPEKLVCLVSFSWIVDNFMVIGALICGFHTNYNFLTTKIIITIMPKEAILVQDLGG